MSAYRAPMSFSYARLAFSRDLLDMFKVPSGFPRRIIGKPVLSRCCPRNGGGPNASIDATGGTAGKVSRCPSGQVRARKPALNAGSTDRGGRSRGGYGCFDFTSFRSRNTISVAHAPAGRRRSLRLPRPILLLFSPLRSGPIRKGPKSRAIMIQRSIKEEMA